MILKGANKITAFSYLYDDIGNSASQNVQVNQSCAIMNSAAIAGVFLLKCHYSAAHSFSVST